MKLKRHRNGNQWEVQQTQLLPPGVCPIVYYYPDTKMFLPVLYLPNNRRLYGVEALSISTAWARLEAMTEKEMQP